MKEWLDQLSCKLGNKYRDFLTFARATGKTVSIRNQALKEFENGKKVAIISAYPESYKSHFKDKAKIVSTKQTKFDKIHLWKFNTILKDIDKRPQAVGEEFFNWKATEGFKDYDFLYVDADCYESIIRDYQRCLDDLKREVDNWRF